jgi:hypothetical protein
MNDQRQSAAKRWLRNRRSQRIELNVPVIVCRPSGEKRQFYEGTQTFVVSAHGALMALTEMVVPKQTLLMQNTESREQQECRVVSVKKELTGPPEIAVEFARPAPGFWHLAFPPTDWTGSV